MTTNPDPASWLADHRDRLLEGLFTLLRAPSVSTDPAHAGDMRRTAAFLMAHVAGIGLQNVQLLDAGGHPAVYADWLGARAAPTVLLYGHYDVQPPDPLDLWHSPPFEPTIRDGRIYCRGASDDKGPFWTMLCALEAFFATQGGLPVNVKLLLEGEEEVGSRTLPAILQRHGEMLRAEVLISADGSMWRPDLVSVNMNSRGLCALEFSVTTADADLHSGRYGGGVANAVTTLCQIVATLHDADRRVAVEGFFEGLRPPSNLDRASIHAIGFDEAGFLAEIGARPGAVERGVPMLEAMWLRPTLEINGISGGYEGVGTKTVLPHAATAKITCRLGIGQDPVAVADAVERHLQAHCPEYATLRVQRGNDGARAYALPEDNPALLAVERVLETLHGKKPLHVGVGGTLPISSMIKQHLGMETVMMSFAVSDSNVHAPDEFIRLSSFDEGLQAWLLFLPELAASHKGHAV
ncbi:dipeptidase [Acidisphaera sp. L21]|uniref:dipeptidase n=1 Tax=Acidisphaera sp. L21 TaxID=1641851 RepID=UPI001C2091A0|nr:dipeptidase [Acidisphaera sp. L21]